MSKPLEYRPAAAVMLLNADNQVFVAQRLDSSLDAWQMPQGGLDPGETAEAGALRELEEETGIGPHLVEIVAQASRELLYDLPPELAGRLWKGRYAGQRQSWFLMRFMGTDADVNLDTEHPEFRNFQWVDPWRLPELIVAFKKPLYEAVLAEFADHLPPREIEPMRPVDLLPYLIPLLVVGVLFLRTRPGRARAVSINSLWIVPLIAGLGIGSALWFQPHPSFGPGAYAIFAVALALGIGTGTLRARTLKLRRCSDTDKVLMETSSFAFILLAALVLLRTAFRNMSGGLGPVAVDASMLFALGMIVTQRLTIWMRVRALPPLAA